MSTESMLKALSSIESEIKKRFILLDKNNSTIVSYTAQMTIAASESDEISIQVNSLIDSTKLIFRELKTLIDSLKTSNVLKQLPTINAISTSYAKRTMDFHSCFNETVGKFREVVKTISIRQLGLIGVSRDDAEKIISSGANMNQVTAQLLVSDDLNEVISDIEQRHSGILKLEKSIRELHEMFVDLATLVDSQSDRVESIEIMVSNAKNSVDNADNSLKDALKEQATARKRSCCILGIIIVVLLVILVPVITHVSGAF